MEFLDKIFCIVFKRFFRILYNSFSTNHAPHLIGSISGSISDSCGLLFKSNLQPFLLTYTEADISL